MFDIGIDEMLLVAVIAIVVIGPKDLPMALRTAGKWIGKMRSLSRHFQSGLDAMIREAEMEEMEKKWKAQNAAIMAQDAASQTPQAAALPADPVSLAKPADPRLDPPAGAPPP